MTLPRIASCEPFVLTMAKFGPKNWSWNVIAHGCYWRNRTTPEDVTITCHGVNPTCELPTKAGHKFKTLFSPSTKVWNWFLASLILWIVHSSSKTGRPTNGTPGIGTLLSSQELPKCNGYLWFILACSLIPLGGRTPHEGGCIDSTFKVQAFHFAVILAKCIIFSTNYDTVPKSESKMIKAIFGRLHKQNTIRVRFSCKNLLQLD